MRVKFGTYSKDQLRLMFDEYQYRVQNPSTNEKKNSRNKMRLEQIRALLFRT